MTCRLDRLLARWLPIVALATACVDRGDQWEREIQDLRTQIADLRRTRMDLHDRVEEFQSRVLIIEDRLETARLLEQSRGRLPRLPVVSVGPAGPRSSPASPVTMAAGRAGTTMAPGSHGQVPVLRIGPNSPTPGPQGKSGTRPPKTLPRKKLAKTDHRGIHARERLAIAPVPPPPGKKGAEAKTPAKRAPRTLTGKRAKDPAARYKNAYDTLKAGDMNGARKRFRSFVSEFPHHPFADNAQYWVGECFYSEHAFEAAVREFYQVIETYPTGNKVPDALLKIGLSYLNLGDEKTAREVLEQVFEIFPDSDAARVARQRVKVL